MAALAGNGISSTTTAMAQGSMARATLPAVLAAFPQVIVPDAWKQVAQRVSDGAWISWVVIGTPSPTGGDAPVPVFPLTVTGTQMLVSG